MILYSALFDGFYPFDIFHPDAEKCVLGTDELPTLNDGYLIVWGGGDIHPSQYGRPIQGAYKTDLPNERDIQEERMMREAVRIGLPIVGVCRGAQLACAIAGGILVQHVEGHGESHMIKTKDGEKILSSSLHHQLMYPWNMEDSFEVLASAMPARSKVYKGLTEYEETIAAYEPEPEVIWFPKIAALAIQGHPEFMEATVPFNLYVKELIDAYIQNRNVR